MGLAVVQECRYSRQASTEQLHWYSLQNCKANATGVDLRGTSHRLYLSGLRFDTGSVPKH